MGNIVEYNNKDDKLTPDEKGYQAAEMAGRRIGPLYTQAAGDIEKQAKFKAQLDNQMLAWTKLTADVVNGDGKGRGGGGGHGGPGLEIPSGGRGGRGGGTGHPATDWADTAARVTGAGLNAVRQQAQATGSLADLQWKLDHHGLNGDEQERMAMLQKQQDDIAAAKMNLLMQKQQDAYKAARDQDDEKWTKAVVDAQNALGDPAKSVAQDVQSDVFQDALTGKDDAGNDTKTGTPGGDNSLFDTAAALASQGYSSVMAAVIPGADTDSPTATAVIPGPEIAPQD